MKPVHARNFQATSSAAVNHRPSYFTKTNTPVLPKEKGDYLADCPWNASHYIAIFYYGFGEGVLEIVKFCS